MDYQELSERVLAIVQERAYRYRRCLRGRSDIGVDDIVSEAMVAFCECGSHLDADDTITDAWVLGLALECLAAAQSRIEATHGGTRESRLLANRPRPLHSVEHGLCAREERPDAIGHDELHFALSALSGYPVEVVEVLASDLNHTEAGEVIGVSKTTVRRHRSTLATLIVCESATMSGSFLSELSE